MNINDGHPKKIDIFLLVACIAAFIASNASALMQPLLVAELLKLPNASESNVGLIVAGELGALAAASVFFSRFTFGQSFRTISVLGTIALAILNWMSMGVANFEMLLLLRILCGFAAGAPLMVSCAAVARYANPDRSYGHIQTLSILVASVMYYLAPTVAKYVNGASAIPCILICILATLPFMIMMPKRERPAVVDSAEVHVNTKMSWSVVGIVFGTFIVCITSASAWAFLFVLGSKTGLDEEHINNIVSFAVLTSVVGSMLASFIGVRFGRLIPFGFGLIVLTGAIAGFSTATTPTVYAVCACLNMISIYFLLPYFYGIAAAEDASGRASAKIGSVILITQALGPYLGGLLIEYFGYDKLAVIVVLGNVVGFLVFLKVIQLSRKKSVGKDGSLTFVED